MPTIVTGHVVSRYDRRRNTGGDDGARIVHPHDPRTWLT